MRTAFLLVFTLPLACVSRNADSGLKRSVQAAAADIIVIGDIQRQLNLAESVSQSADDVFPLSISDEALLKMTADYGVFAPPDLDLKGVLEQHPAAEVIQMGDMVDWNNGLTFSLRNGESRKTPFDEWSVLEQFPRDTPIWSTAGNHEAYKSVTFRGDVDPQNNAFVRFSPTQPEILTFSPSERQELMRRRYPNLREANFIDDSASYWIERDKFVLLSIDANGLTEGSKISEDQVQEQENRANALVQAIDQAMVKIRSSIQKKPLIVINHFPFFKAERDSDFSERNRSRLLQLFQKHRVELSLNGHEHLYLRIAKSHLSSIGYEADQNHPTMFVTFGAFGNPYADDTLKKVAKNPRIDLAQNDLGNGKLERFILTDKSHYGAIRITDKALSVDVLAIKTDGQSRTEKWETIDSFSVPLAER